MCKRFGLSKFRDPSNINKQMSTKYINNMYDHVYICCAKQKLIFKS